MHCDHISKSYVTVETSRVETVAKGAAAGLRLFKKGEYDLLAKAVVKERNAKWWRRLFRHFVTYDEVYAEMKYMRGPYGACPAFERWVDWDLRHDEEIVRRLHMAADSYVGPSMQVAVDDWYLLGKWTSIDK